MHLDAANTLILVCGFLLVVSILAGIISNQQEIDHTHLIAMRDKMLHRGPDDEGIYKFENVILGHVRLSIIDLSEKGKQPMSNDGRLWITYNGEIYNFKEIKYESPFNTLNKLLLEHTNNLNKTNYPKEFQGGAIGFFSYDTGRLLENIPSIAKNDQNVPEILLGFYNWVIIHDNQTYDTFITSTGAPNRTLRTANFQLNKILNLLKFFYTFYFYVCKFVKIVHL